MVRYQGNLFFMAQTNVAELYIINMYDSCFLCETNVRIFTLVKSARIENIYLVNDSLILIYKDRI
jgi:hypothetical protein